MSPDTPRIATRRLICHPATPCPAVRALEVTVAQAACGELALRYRITADEGALVLPPPENHCLVPTDGLWQRTCCEVFLSRVGQSAYREFNFSPSGAWASYAFASTRQRDTAGEAAWQMPAAIRLSGSNLGFELIATLPAGQLPAGAGRLCLGLSVVIESRDRAGEQSGAGARLSYWALKHPAPQPDFHHRDAFSLTLG